MAYARLYIPYSEGEYHDWKALHNDIIRVLTGNTDISTYELAKSAGSSFFVNTIPAGWELVRTEVFDYTGSHLYSPAGTISKNSGTTYITNTIASQIRAPIDGFTDKYKYLTILTGVFSNNVNASTQIKISFYPGDIDDGTVWGAVKDQSLLTTELSTSWKRGIETKCILKRNQAYYFDISCSARHLSLIPLQYNTNASPLHYLERTRLVPEDTPLNGFVPAFCGYSSLSDTSGVALNCAPFPLEDNGRVWDRFYARVGVDSPRNLNSLISTTYVKGGTEKFLFVKPMIYHRLIPLGEIHPDIPVHWLSKTGNAVSSWPAGGELLIDGARFMIHDQEYPKTEATIPILYEIK